MKNKIRMKPNRYFQILHGDGLFPLTPALSLGERENRSQLFGEATTVCCSMACEFYENIQRLSPLPRGEGEGEGKADALTMSAHIQNQFNKHTKNKF
jgi:hypothetical protein